MNTYHKLCPNVLELHREGLNAHNDKVYYYGNVLTSTPSGVHNNKVYEKDLRSIRV